MQIRYSSGPERALDFGGGALFQFFSTSRREEGW